MTQVFCDVSSCKYRHNRQCIKDSITVADGAYGSEWVHAECSGYKNRNNK